MTTWLVIALALLWILVIALSLTVYALTRQLGVLFERVAPAGALMINQNLKVGDPAPKLTLQSLAGKTLDIGGAASGKNQLLFFLAPDCPICKSLLPVLKSLANTEQAVDIILASDGGDREEHEGYVTSNKLAMFPYVLSELLGRSYGVSKLPYATLIRPDGAIGSMGIVNSREHLESLFEAEAMQVASIQEYLARPGTTGHDELPEQQT